jgi:hypothetical protein
MLSVGGTLFLMGSFQLIRGLGTLETLRDRIRTEAKRVEEDTLHSAKRHFIAASYWRKVHLAIGIPATILAGCASVASFSQQHNTLAGVAAIVVAALTALITFLNPNESAKGHLDAGNRYLTLRNRARIFYEIDSSMESTDEDLVNQLKELTSERDALNQNSPITPKRAFIKAREGIEAGEAEYRVDKKARRKGHLSDSG